MSLRSDGHLPNEAQRQKLCEMLYRALLQIRSMARSHPEQAAGLADLFHNLPHEMWRDYFSVSFLRRALMEYQTRFSMGVKDYLDLLDEVERLRSSCDP